MALKEDLLKQGLRRGIDGEQRKVASRFDRAEQALAQSPAGLAAPRAARPATTASTFTGESKPLPARREILAVPLDALDDNPFNARRIYSPEKVRELAASLATHGQKVPATAMRHPSDAGRYLLIDGHYRKQAAKAAGQSSLEVVLEPALADSDLYRVSFLLNQERNAQSVLDNALAWDHLINTRTVAKEEDLVGLTGQSWATVNKTLALLKLPASVLERMRENAEAFGIAVAYELTLFHKQAGEQKTAELAERVVGEGLGRRDIEALRKSLAKRGARKKKEVGRQYRIRGPQGQQIGFIKDWDNGRVSLELRLADARDREALVAELKTRFGIE